MTDTSLELEMHTLGKSRYLKRLVEARANRNESSIPAVRFLMRTAIAKVEVALLEWLEAHEAQLEKGRQRQSAYPYLRTIPADVAAFISCRVIFDRISAENAYTGTASAIGSALQDELHYGALKDAHKTLFARMVSILKKKSTKAHRRKRMVSTCREVLKESYEDWGTQKRCVVGTVMIELILASTGVLEREVVPHAINGVRRPKTILRPTQETLEWLEKSHERHAVMSPFYMPTKVRPVHWTSQDDGGYASDQLYRRNLVKSSYRGMADLTGAQMPKVYQAVNAIQDTAWLLNEDVWQVMLYLREQGGGVAGLPLMSDMPMPPKPEDIDTNEEARKIWSKAAGSTRLANTMARSARLSLAKLLLVAERMQGSPFWFPQQLDFRGRCYPLPFFLQPQGHDTARGLLRFAEGKPLHDPEALGWFFIHGANVFGEDKVNFQARMEWVQAHRQQILAVYQDPLDCLWWTEADKPWQFLAWCLEFGGYTDDPEGFKSHLPVAMDGSNNGLQVYSMLLRDPVGAKATNVSASPEPQDIYRDVADIVTTKLREWARRTELADDHWKTKAADDFLVWVGGAVPRECTKRSVMTLPYGSTAYANRRYVTEWYAETAEKKGMWIWPAHDHFKECAFIAEVVWESIGSVVQAARVGMDWLKSVAQATTKAGLPLRWTTPLGFPVSQDYRKHFACTVQTAVGDRVKINKLHLPTDLKDPKRQRNGVAPNYVHSLDAAACMATVNLAYSRGIRHFAMIHDSYGVLAADAPLMAKTLREAYVEMFSAPLLEEFRAEIQAQMPAGVELPPVPPSGTLQLEDVLSSPYFFA